MKDDDFDTETSIYQNKRLKIENQGCPNDCVGQTIAKTNEGQYVVNQLSLVDAIINDVGIDSKQRKVLMSSHK